MTQSGTILVSGRWGSARDSVDGHACIFASDDMGAHWELRYDGFGLSELAGIRGEIKTMSLTELVPGALTASLLWVDRSEPELPFINESTQGLLPMRILHATSHDEGRTWSTYRIMETAPHVAASPCTCAVFRLPDGALCQPYEHWKEYRDSTRGHPGARLRLSRDEGKSWPEYLTVAWHEENLIAYWDQRLGKHPSSGQLVAMFWTHDFVRAVDIDVHISWGSADARQWSPPQSTALPGQHCQPLAVGGDTLLAVYAHRRNPPGIALSISPDFGRSWDRSLDLKVYESLLGTESGAEGARSQDELWNDMELWRFGHPRSSILPNGEVFVVYYAGDDTIKNACWARVRL